MRERNTYFVVLLVLLFAAVVITSCSTPERSHDYTGLFSSDFRKIVEGDTLIAVTATNSTDYFIYRGTPMGFQLELLQQFATQMGVQLKIIVENDIEKSISMLVTGQCHLVAQRRLSGMCKLNLIGYSDALAGAQPILVQRYRSDMIEDFGELSGKTIHLAKSTVMASHLKRYALKNGISLDIVEVDSLDAEQMLEAVSKSVFDYTVIDENVAILYSGYYQNLNYGVKAGEALHLSWVVSKHSTALLDSINTWIVSASDTETIDKLFRKYYRHRYGSNAIDYSDYINYKDRISPFDDLIKMHSQTLNWDWRLLASLIYQESRFNPNAVSWAGAIGIMQLMPETAMLYGIDSSSNVSDHIAAGVTHLKNIDALIPDDVCDSTDRIKITMAAYNIGYSHLKDAMALAEKYGRNYNTWKNNIEFFLLHLSDPRFYTDSVVSSGYCPGRLAVGFVDEIFNRYQHYSNIIPEK